MQTVVKRILTCVVAVPVCMVATIFPAEAAPPPPLGKVTPSMCIREFTDNDNYIEDGWVNARVQEYFPGPPFVLGCGDELSGVVHIAHPASTGTVHPLDPSGAQDGVFTDCIGNTLYNGKTSETSPGRVRHDWDYGAQEQRASVFVDKARSFVYTAFTNTPNGGNDWAGCAAGFP